MSGVYNRIFDRIQENFKRASKNDPLVLAAKTICSVAGVISFIRVLESVKGKELLPGIGYTLTTLFFLYMLSNLKSPTDNMENNDDVQP